MKIKRTRCDSTRSDQEELAGLPPTFINMASHWWDASAIYGSDPDITNSLRLLEGGKLRMENRRLPVRAQRRSRRQDFRLIGGLGWNYYTLFSRSSTTRSVIGSGSSSRNWGDEQLFQTARLVNAALMAKIHMVEWTPALLGHRRCSLG